MSINVEVALSKEGAALMEEEDAALSKEVGAALLTEGEGALATALVNKAVAPSPVPVHTWEEPMSVSIESAVELPGA